MGPKHPEARDLGWEQAELHLDRVDNGAGTPIAGQERWGILAIDRILGVASERMGEEAAMDVQEGCPLEAVSVYITIGKRG